MNSRSLLTKNNECEDFHSMAKLTRMIKKNFEGWGEEPDVSEAV